MPMRNEVVKSAWESGAYKECPASATFGPNGYYPEPLVYHYVEAVLDWSADISLLANHCRADKKVFLPPGEAIAVYVMAAEGADFCKIGISDSPQRRLNDLQTAHWADLSVYAAVWVWGLNGALSVETLSHRTARQMGVEVKREWVRLQPIEALTLVLQICAGLGTKATSDEGMTVSQREAMASLKQVTARIDRERNQIKSARLGWA